MAQSIQGQELAFAWDQAAGLPQVLATSDGARFLYGLERLGLIEGGEWAYELHDALGSVPQWTDANAAVLGVQAYGPYGEPLTGLGAALSSWGAVALGTMRVACAPRGLYRRVAGCDRAG